jgi:hypothetical protein
MVQIQIELSEDQAQALERLSVKHGVPVAYLLREGVALIIEGGDSPDRRARRQRALATLGCFRSGCGDLAEKHDRYLAEAHGQ